MPRPAVLAAIGAALVLTVGACADEAEPAASGSGVEPTEADADAADSGESGDGESDLAAWIELVSEAPPSDPGTITDDGFRPVLTTAAPESDATCPPGAIGGLDGECHVAAEAATGLDIVESADASRFQDLWTVEVVLTSEGVEAFNDLAADCFAMATTCPTGRIAIVVDGVVVTAPTVAEPSFDSDDIVISGAFEEAEAEGLAAVLTP